MGGELGSGLVGNAGFLKLVFSLTTALFLSARMSTSRGCDERGGHCLHVIEHPGERSILYPLRHFRLKSLRNRTRVSKHNCLGTAVAIRAAATGRMPR